MESSLRARFVLGALTVALGLFGVGYIAEAREHSEANVRAAPVPVRHEPGRAHQPGVPGSDPPPRLEAAGGLEVPAGGSGRFTVAGGMGAVVGGGRMVRYQVVVEEGSGVDPAGFAAAVERTLADPRGWTAGRRWGFQRVSGGPSDLTVHLATPATTEALCDRFGVETRGEVSCRGGRNVVINLKRWRLGVPWYGDALDEYRHMLVNHEVGHFLGYGHMSCPGAGRAAPVMQQQTFGLGGCVRNGWPYPDRTTFVSGPSARR